MGDEPLTADEGGRGAVDEKRWKDTRPSLEHRQRGPRGKAFSLPAVRRGGCPCDDGMACIEGNVTGQLSLPK